MAAIEYEVVVEAPRAFDVGTAIAELADLPGAAGLYLADGTPVVGFKLARTPTGGECIRVVCAGDAAEEEKAETSFGGSVVTVVGEGGEP
jgi:hypothetical protein